MGAQALMSERETILRLLSQASRRLRLQSAWGGAGRGLLGGGAIWLVVLGLSKLLPVGEGAVAIAGAAALLAIPGAAIAAAMRRPGRLETARWLDRRIQLQERLSAAVELAEHPQAGGWSRLVQRDAAAHVGDVQLDRVIPYRLDAVFRSSLAVWAVGFGLGFVPEHRSAEHRQRMADEAIVQSTGRRLVELTRYTLKESPEIRPAAREAFERVEALGAEWGQVKLTRQEALRDLARVSDQLRQELRQLNEGGALDRLRRAARASGADPGTRLANEALARKLSESLGKAGGDPAAIEALKRELEKAREAAGGLGSSAGAPGSAAREQLGQFLRGLAQQGMDMGISLPDLRDAIEALATEPADLLVRDLDAAISDLEKLESMAQSLERLQQRMERLGKDLAEQIEKGQAQAAIQTLNRMSEQLRGAGLPDAVREQVLDEVARAVSPAGQFENVARALQKAVQEMKERQTARAAESLDEAARELERLLEGMGDADAIRSALAALGRAQMCASSGQGWGQCQRPAAGQGGKPGQGYGTWAEEDGWLAYPEMSDLWLNPPESRPEMDPRSGLDRGEGELAENLSPTRIRGEIGPGSSMPSITLKGVSVQGMSTVQFQEAVLGAQEDAQNALSQERIPRAYRGAVRDYFDDLKQ